MNEKGFGFLSIARKLGEKYDKKLRDAATKTGIEAAKTTSKRVVQKTAETTGDLIGNKIADKITSVKKDEIPFIFETFIPTEKRQQIMIHD